MPPSRIRTALLLILWLLAISPRAQEAPGAPTLTAPTLAPTVQAPATPDSKPTLSTVAEIAASSLFRVGVLYNDPPYSELTLQGQLSGFDADLLRKIAAAWECEIEFVQVTRLNALDKLNGGLVHAVASALPHYRDLAATVGFSQTYLRGKQAMMVSAGSPYTRPAELSDQLIGFALGTRAEKALDIWRERLGLDLNLRGYLTLDRAAAALTRSEIAGLVGEEQALLRVTADERDKVRLLEASVLGESRALAVRRQDAPLRQLLNRTLQFLAQAGELDVLFREYFPDASYNGDALTLWSGIGDAVRPADFPAEILYPAAYALPRIVSSGVLRVGGPTDSGLLASAGEKRLAELNRALAAELAERWNLELRLIHSDAASAAQLLDTGTVDLVIGVKPDWAQANAVDFSAPYLLHGDRLMVRGNSGIGGFNNLRGRIIGILISDPASRGRATAWADSINASVRFFQTTESGAALTLLEHNNANAIYADSLALLEHLEANRDALRLTERWYSRSYYAFALPYNDPDLRLLLEYTLQELIVDGSLLRLTAPMMVADELPDFDIVPGASQFAGINLSSASA